MPCHTCHLHTTRQANVILQRNKDKRKTKQNCPGFEFKPRQVNDSSQSNKLTDHLVSQKERLLGDESSLTSESESEMCHKDLPVRQRPVKSSVLHLGFSSSSELEESSLEKSRSLRAAHAQNIILWNFFFFSPKRYFFLPSPLSLESFRLL
jgi:hypothetical protein